MKRNYAFICYSSFDFEFAKKLSLSLSDNGVSHWLDRNELKAGDSLIGRIEQAIQKAHYFIVVLSNRSINSNWVQKELRAAYHTEIQIEKKFIIPIILDNCELPLFIKDYVYVDFKNIGEYERNLEYLIKSLDAEYIPNSRAVSVHSLESDKLLAVLDDDPEGVSQFMAMPLNKLWRKAFELEAYEGDFKEQLFTYLVLDGEQDKLNVLSAMIFLTHEIESKKEVSRELLVLLSGLVEDEGIYPPLRHTMISRLHKIFSNVNGRSDRLLLLPRIFPKKRLNNLADIILADAFKPDGTNALNKLWEMGSAFYREEILRYLSRRFLIEIKPSAIETLVLNRKWENVTNYLNLKKLRLRPRHVKINSITWDQDPGFFDLEVFIDLFERACRKTKTDHHLLVRLTKMVSLDEVNLAIQTFGKNIVYQFLIEIIRSPKIDAYLSTKALVSLIFTFKFDGLNYYPEFPRCLITTKETGLFRKFNVLKGLVTGAANDKTLLFTLCEILNRYRERLFWQLAFDELENKKLSPYSTILRFLNGEVTINAVRDELYPEAFTDEEQGE